MCSHSDGSLSTWTIKDPKKPASVIMPHGKEANIQRQMKEKGKQNTE